MHAMQTWRMQGKRPPSSNNQTIATSWSGQRPQGGEKTMMRKKIGRLVAMGARVDLSDHGLRQD